MDKNELEHRIAVALESIAGSLKEVVALAREGKAEAEQWPMEPPQEMIASFQRIQEENDKLRAAIAKAWRGDLPSTDLVECIQRLITKAQHSGVEF